MKAILPAVLILLTGALALADEPVVNRSVGSTAATAADGAGPGAPDPGLKLPVPAAMPVVDPVPAPPVVRIPVPVPAPSAAGPAGDATTAELGWSSDGVGLRSARNPIINTNRFSETRGVLPRLTKPERRSFGGFLTGFANLFNPLAPTSQGTAAREGHIYDGQLNPAPLPRGFRDERYHEAKWELLTVPLERDPDGFEREPIPAPAPAR